MLVPGACWRHYWVPAWHDGQRYPAIDTGGVCRDTCQRGELIIGIPQGADRDEFSTRSDH